MNKRKPTATKAKSYSISLPPAVFQKARTAAFRQHRSFSQFVRDAVLAALATPTAR